MQGIAAGIGLLRSAAVRRLWLAGAAAGVMRWLEILAFGLVALEATGSPLVVASMSFARFLPLLLVGAPIAVLAERAEPRRLLVAAYLAMAAVSLVASVAAFLGHLRLWHLMTLAIVNGVFWCVEIPVRRAFLAAAGGHDRLAVSMSLEMITTHLTRATGPALGGALVAGAGMPGVIALGAALYLAGAGLIARVPKGSPAPPGRSTSLARGLAEGLAAVRADRRLLAVVVLTVIFNLFGLPYLGLMPVIAVERLALGPVGTGLVATGEGIGALVATVLILGAARPAWYGPIFGLGCCTFFVAVLALAAAPSAALAFLALFVAGFGMAGFSAMQATLPFAIAPPEARVRVTGVVMVAIGSAPFGFLLAGALGDRLGGGPAMALIGALGLLATGVALRRWPMMASPAGA